MMILFLHHNLDYLNSPSQVLCVCEVGQKHLCLLQMIAALYWREQQIVVVAALSATSNGVGGTSSGSWEKKNGMTANRSALRMGRDVRRTKTYSYLDTC